MQKDPKRLLVIQQNLAFGREAKFKKKEKRCVHYAETSLTCSVGFCFLMEISSRLANVLDFVGG